MLKYYGKGCSDIQVTNASNGHKKIINKKPMEGKCLHPKPKKKGDGNNNINIVLLRIFTIKKEKE